jgi:hypothetical protein
MWKMTSRSIPLSAALAAGIAFMSLLSTDVLGQAPASPPVRTPASSVRKMPWGDPDIQGIWTNTTTTPVERPRDLADKAELSEDEREVVGRQTAERVNQDKPGAAGSVVPYNEFWYERGTYGNRTSLVIDPADGRIPALTPEAQTRWDGQIAARREHPADSWLDRSSYDRCISRGMPGAMLPGFYNHNYEIVQTKTYVAILVEMIHDTRIVPLDGRLHLANGVGQWLGDSLGHWEGDTLVVDTTNFSDKTRFRGSSERLHVVERFTRLDGESLLYRFTVEDPTTWVRSWTGETVWPATDDRLYEYACHEGNYALGDILRGARLRETEELARKNQK